jgi:hypothetical protein
MFLIFFTDSDDDPDCASNTLLQTITDEAARQVMSFYTMDIWEQYHSGASWPLDAKWIGTPWDHFFGGLRWRAWYSTGAAGAQAAGATCICQYGNPARGG